MEPIIVEENIDSRKLRGGYYTPQPIADFICKWAITEPAVRVLEPSCGDGNFVEAVIQRLLEIGVPKNELFGRIKGVELLAVEAQKSKARAANYGLNSTTITNADFFSFLAANPAERFDVVVGNPPFIRYQNFPEEHRSLAIYMMQEMGLNPNKLTNIWVPFLVLSAGRLNPGGKLGMVIPAELFQVKYAAETRVFLSRFFERVTIVTFKKLVFKDIQQEVVLLLCEKEVAGDNGIRVVEVTSLEELETLDIEAVQNGDVKILEHNTEKWTKYFLDEAEIHLLRRFKTDPRIQLAGELMITNVGLVTGINEFFMITQQTAEQWGILPYTKRVVSRSAHFRGIKFTEQDFLENAAAEIDSFLFLPPDEDFDKLPPTCQAYIRFGESKNYHKGYKCKIRKRWYITPSVYEPGGFALRQVGDYPKLIVNETNASSTDTIHRVRFQPKVDPKKVALSFLNSLTFAFSEITGRSYGGGVLTFEPTEIGEIPLPLLVHDRVDFEKVDGLIRERRIEEVMDLIDRELLIKQLKFTAAEVKQFRSIWKKLSGRRLNRK
ncbi:class I SAM-dependent methyltransferase [Mucilaginibacter sabulilitoris]|uniref:site-specific DNA-methyltransferase (adenine-specific) n=1 Tax=Mucilaginibacter sabulilitoris TaxID=1173583 RepID=A0ABZ0TU75_9SPHI|nr:class I SAM-dependent methyltransferase [Mucilaginibacter sabulilitoris]WPU95708.1 class I SAM-dependent methyltransferase [Mucilaginibacter sabulilitoris]